MSNVIVIGAGAAGMMAAITAAGQGHKVTVLEKNEKPGKKLYITGKGRCNITNDCDVETLLNNVMVNKKFLYSAFYGFTSQDMMALLEDAGLEIKVERGNRVFPQSDKSSDVIRTLTNLMSKNGVKVYYRTEVKDLLTESTDEQLKIKGVVLENGETMMADDVVIATGGISYVMTGSSGDGYKFAKATGHKVTDLSPSLVPMNISEDWVKSLQGLSLKNVSLTIYKGKKKIYDDFGEMLFTHFGISGPLVLSASPQCIKDAAGGQLRAVIDLKPALSVEQLDHRLLKDFDKYANKQFHNALSDLLPAKLIPVIVDLSRIDPYKKVNEITKAERTKLLELLKGLEMHVTGLRGYNEAIITRGGVSVKDVNPSTMESKHCKGLYFAGEVLDLDALTGGFNLQIAWSTARLAGMSIE